MDAVCVGCNKLMSIEDVNLEIDGNSIIVEFICDDCEREIQIHITDYLLLERLLKEGVKSL